MTGDERPAGGPGGSNGPAAGSSRKPLLVVLLVLALAGVVGAGAGLLLSRSHGSASGAAAADPDTTAGVPTVASVDDIPDLTTYSHPPGQPHVTTAVDYPESPPVGGPHDPEWADCTGTVYDVAIRPENAVHALEHGASWITYDPAAVGPDDVATLERLVSGRAGLMLSPYPGLSSAVSVQSWDHQLFLDSVDDPRLQQFTDLLTFADGMYPEVGASCENPGFAGDPLLPGEPSRATGGAAVPTDTSVLPGS